MKKTTWRRTALASCFCLAPLVFSTGVAIAQDNEGDSPRKRRQDRVVRDASEGDKAPSNSPEGGARRLRAQGGPAEGGPMGPAMMMQRLPLMMALDTNRDGTISADEIEKASESLRKLDKNGDGKLSVEELRPEFPGRGPDMAGRGPEMAGRGTGPAPGAGNPVENFKRLLKARDTNGDGKLSGDEIPPAMVGRIERIDLNGDGAIDEDEIASMGGRPGARPEKGDEAKGREQRGDGSGVKPKRPSDGQ